MTPKRLRLADLTTRAEFELVPDAKERQALAEALGLIALKKLRFAGVLSPDSERDWRLDGVLGATTTQSCVATLAPVTTRIDEPVIRRYMAAPSPEGEEMEMPEDDTIEPIPAEVDLSRVMAEALALALPAWPRAADADPVELRFAAPGISPMSDNDAKPFSSLKTLKDRLDEDGPEDG